MDTDSLREQLGRVRERLGDRILLSRVGIALREIDQAFSPEAHSALNLTDLLRRVPDIGKIVGEGSQRTFVFEGASATPGGPVRLQSHVWRAVTDFKTEAGGWHMDLETFQLRHASRDPEKLLQTESERFVAVPALGVDFQKQLARGFVQEHLPAQSEAVEKALSGHDWTAALLGILDAAGLGERWAAFRSSRITEETLKWAEKHGVPRERIVEPPRAERRTSSAPDTSPGGDLADMRVLIHDAIEMMSLPELAALNVPPAYLVLAGSRRRR